MRPKRAQRTNKLPGKSRGAHNCKAEVALIADYLANELSPNTATAFDHHLSACSDCAAFLRTYKKTIDITRAFLSRERSQSSRACRYLPVKHKPTASRDAIRILSGSRRV